jgi:hypothetical protein
MNRFVRLGLLALCGIASVLTASQSPQKTSMAGSPANESQATIEGLLRDIACPIQNLDSNATHLSVKCVQDCVKGGSPLAILTPDGYLYLPISDTMPDYGQQEKLMPLVGKYVQATGTVFERHGTRAIVIAEIKELKGVHLTLEGE